MQFSGLKDYLVSNQSRAVGPNSVLQAAVALDVFGAVGMGVVAGFMFWSRRVRSYVDAGDATAEQMNVLVSGLVASVVAGVVLLFPFIKGMLERKYGDNFFYMLIVGMLIVPMFMLYRFWKGMTG